MCSSKWSGDDDDNDDGEEKCLGDKEHRDTDDLKSVFQAFVVISWMATHATRLLSANAQVSFYRKVRRTGRGRQILFLGCLFRLRATKTPIHYS
jgi:hypothetical protein